MKNETDWMRRSADIRYRAWEHLRLTLLGLFGEIEQRERAQAAVESALDAEIAQAYAAGFKAGAARARAVDAAGEELDRYLAGRGVPTTRR